MKRFLLLSLLLVATLGLNVQCTTSYASEKSYGSESAPRDLAERNLKIKKTFSEVDVKLGVKLFYTVGTDNTVRIVGSEDVVNRTVVTVEDGTLKVYIDQARNSHFKNHDGPAVYVTAPAFRSVSMSVGSIVNMQSPLVIKDDFSVRGSSGAIFKTEKGLTCGTLELRPSSGSIVDISSLKATTAQVHASSGAIVTLSGTVSSLEAHISSGAIANITDLKATEGSVKASSGAIVNVNKGNLSVKSSSGAIVHQN